MSDTMLALGPFRFSIDTAAYGSSMQVDTFDWREQGQIGSRPALQFTGFDQTRDLSGVIYPHHRGGFGQIERMRRLGLASLPLPLMSGDGRLLGVWVILSVTEEQAIFDRSGSPKRQDFTVRLRRFDGGLRGLLPL
jgi:phage protein U